MHSAPRGQILLIGAVAMVVILGTAALVVDLGFSWMLRRQEQNAVDPASVAAARFLPEGDWSLGPPPEAIEAACFYVQQHGFFDGDANCAAALAAGDMYVGLPRSGPSAGRPGFVEVWINASHTVFFGRILGQSEAWVATAAVAANGGSGVGSVNANALVSFDPTTCGAGQITGNGQVNITKAGITPPEPGGSIYINSICGIDPPGATADNSCQGSSGQGGLQFSGNHGVLVTEQITIRGTCNPTSNPINLPTTEGADGITDGIFGLTEPSRDGQPEWGRTNCPAGGALLSPGPVCSFTRSGVTTVSPGVYYGGIVISGQAQVHFNPGVYYIAGGGIQYQGNASSSFEVVGGTDGNPGRALFFSTGDPTYGGVCALDPTFPQNAPPQSASPDGNLTLDPPAGPDSWLTETDLPGTFTSINELVADDSTYLKSPSDPVSPNHFEVSLSDIVPPIPDTGVFVRYRFGEPVGSDAQIDLEVELLQGTTVIASQPHPDIPSITTGWQDGSIPLTSAHIAAITDWTDLRLNFKATTPIPGTDGDVEADRALVSWAQLQIPAIGTRNCQGMIRLAGQADVSAWATDIEPWAGLLMWQDGTLDGNGRGNNPVAMIDVQGNGGMNISGTIYAPKALVKIMGNGTSDADPDVAAVQVLSWQFIVGGNGVLNIPYDPEQFFGDPSPAQKGLVQ